MSDAAFLQSAGSAGVVPFWRQIAYSVGQVAGQVYRDIPSLLLLFFLTTVIGIEPGAAGLAIFVPKLVVGVTVDFVVGTISGRSPRKWPAWLLAGAALAPIGMAVLFRVPDAPQNLQIVFIVAVFSFYMAAFSVFSVPYLAIASRLASDPHQRTVLMAWRLAFTAIGVLLASGAAPFFVATFGGGQSAYELLGFVLAALCAGALVVAYLGIRGTEPFSQTADQSTVPSPGFSLSGFGKALSRPRFAVLFSANLIQLTASGMAYAAFLYFLIYNLGRSDAFEIISILIVISSAGIILSQPVWVSLSKRFGKKPIFIVATFLHAAVGLAFGFAGSEISLYAVFGLMLLMGIGNSGWTLLGFSMVTDIASEGDPGIYSAAWVSADKIGFALGGTALIGLTLHAFGFSAANAVQGLPQSETAITGIAMAFGFIPAGLKIFAGILFWVFGRDN